MKRLDAMLEEYERLKKILEKKGYSGIAQYEPVPLSGRVVCRLSQLAVLFFIVLLFKTNDVREFFAGEGRMEKVVLVLLVIVLVAIILWSMDLAVQSLRSEPLPVSGYFARRKIRMETEKLRAEIAQFDERERALEPILEKIAEAAVIIEDQLGGETEFVREVGKSPHFKALLERDAVLAKIIQPKECAPDAKSDDELFNEKYIQLVYDVAREGVCAELSYNVAILLEWKKTKVAEKELRKRFTEEAKRSK